VSVAWYHTLCVAIIAVEVLRPLALIVYGGFLMVRALRGLARLPYEPHPRRAPGRRVFR
jgi:hypothetical protein